MTKHTKEPPAAMSDVPSNVIDFDYFGDRATPEAIASGYVVEVPRTVYTPDGPIIRYEVRITPKGMDFLRDELSSGRWRPERTA